MKVLFILNNAPKYKEHFLRGLGENIELTIISEKSQAYENDFERHNYKYYESNCYSFFCFRFQPQVLKELTNTDYDLILCSWNLRYIDRYLTFLLSRRKQKWIWWGHIIGRRNNFVVKIMRSYFLSRSSGVLVYSKNIKDVLHKEGFNCQITSFNNSEILNNEFRSPKWEENPHQLNLLFVGRNQKRKKLKRLIDLLQLAEFIHITLVGPGMIEEFQHINHDRLIVKGPIDNNSLDSEFEWCDAVISPGHLGLMVMNAARYGKPLIQLNCEYHGPEIQLAYDSNQIFLSFDDKERLYDELKKLNENKEILVEKGLSLQNIAKNEFTVENMIKIHLDEFKRTNINI